jgi:hypothetical protein
MTTEVNQRRTLLRWAVLAVLPVAVAACDGGGPTSPSQGGPYTQTVTGMVSVFGTTRHTLDVPRSGDMRLTLSWTGLTDLDLYLTVPTCQSLYPQPQCGIILASKSTLGTQEVISRTVNQGESYAIFVDNLSTTIANNYTLDIRID